MNVRIQALGKLNLLFIVLSKLSNKKPNREIEKKNETIIKAFVFIEERKLRKEMFSGDFHCFHFTSKPKAKQRVEQASFVFPCYAFRHLSLVISTIVKNPSSLNKQEIKKCNKCQDVWSQSGQIGK